MRARSAALGLLLLAGAARAGGPLESFDISEGAPSPVPGHVVAEIIGIRWDPRCIPVAFRVNDSQDPLPDPLGGPGLSVEQARASLQRAMDRWNEIPTSFIEMGIVGTTQNPGRIGFDFVNEQSFDVRPGLLIVASSPSTSLLMDTVFREGDDVDEDGDPDVSAALEACADADGDGDLEFPAGFYEAGTILDNDVQYNADLFRFTAAEEDIDAVSRSLDLEGVAIHELGHSHGLSHVVDNQISARDGTSATMFPFVDSGDPDSERSLRSLDGDDVAWSSLVYPEGTASSGPAALQAGDVAFDARFGMVEGEVADGDTGLPLAGASVWLQRRADGRRVGAGFSGTTRASFNPATGVLFAVLNHEYSIVDGRYRIPAPRGVYDVGIEAIDGSPVGPASIGFSARIAQFLEVLDFTEELHGGRLEGALEVDAGRSQPVRVRPGRRSGGVDFVTDSVELWAGFGNLNFVGLTTAGSGFSYAVAFPVGELEAIAGGEDVVIQAALFHTYVTDLSVVPVFASAELARCEVPGDGTLRVDRQHPFRRVRPFAAQDSDFAPLYFQNPEALTREIRDEIRRGGLSALCLVLQLPEAPFPGVTGLAPLIGLDGDLEPGGENNDVPIRELSFVSTDGVGFEVEPRFNFLFALQLTRRP